MDFRFYIQNFYDYKTNDQVWKAVKKILVPGHTATFCGISLAPNQDRLNPKAWAAGRVLDLISTVNYVIRTDHYEYWALREKEIKTEDDKIKIAEGDLLDWVGKHANKNMLSFYAGKLYEYKENNELADAYYTRIGGE